MIKYLTEEVEWRVERWKKFVALVSVGAMAFKGTTAIIEWIIWAVS